MSTLEITSISSKGQVVIPSLIRNDLGLKPGSKLAVITDGRNVLLKPLEAPKLAQFEKLVAESRSLARRTGLRKTDVTQAIRKVRHARRG